VAGPPLARAAPEDQPKLNETSKTGGTLRPILTMAEVVSQRRTNLTK
jgi:hypothetical protein